MNDRDKHSCLSEWSTLYQEKNIVNKLSLFERIWFILPVIMFKLSNHAITKTFFLKIKCVLLEWIGLCEFIIYVLGEQYFLYCKHRTDIVSEKQRLIKFIIYIYMYFHKARTLDLRLNAMFEPRVLFSASTMFASTESSSGDC